MLHYIISRPGCVHGRLAMAGHYERYLNIHLLRHKFCASPQSARQLSLTMPRCRVEALPTAGSPTKSTIPPTEPSKLNNIYHGPLSSTFRRLKIFSLASLSLSCTLAPVMFIVESALPMSARMALASIAIGTSGISTVLVGWCGKPYVTTLKRLMPEEHSGLEGLEMTTLTLALKPRVTRVYDPTFLIQTRRPFAKWELAEKVVIPPSKFGELKNTTSGQEETIAETVDKNGNVVGRWIVTWGANGEGVCREVGSVMRYFNIHEELLS